ncbi:MAG TPA: STAS domain-containing protein [Aggregatilineaceae bacterium]|jgi:anti-sigma B factor antagonist|nr:STAS domain-containing protein [Anaerolineae bacterium]HMM29853.1 STAS domain-containing protein [Aggregatilineaceae bacterium]
MNITEREQDGVTIYSVEGRVDSEGAVDLDMALQAATADGKNKMVLEMAEVRYINSAGLRTLADILTQNQKAGGDLKLVNLHPKVKRVFQIIGFERFFNIYESIDEAVAAF